MKRLHSYSFLRSLLFSLTLILVACKQNNKTAQTQTISAYQEKAFLVIPHNDQSSLLREKLLHKKINSLLKTETAIQLERGDQFKIGKETFSPMIKEQLEYEKLKASSAEVIVSYSDRTEIYFAPAGILRDRFLADLHLNYETGRDIEWAPLTPSMLSQGSAYYLISFSTQDLVENDRNMFKAKIDSPVDFQKLFTFSTNQKIQLALSIDYFAKETTYEIISGGPQMACKADMREAGMCEPCLARRETTTGKLLASKLRVEDLKLQLMIDGEKHLFSEFNPELAKDGKTVLFTLDFSAYKKDSQVQVQFLEPETITRKKWVTPGNFEGLCRSRSTAGVELDVTPAIKWNYQLDVYGRRWMP